MSEPKKFYVSRDNGATWVEDPTREAVWNEFVAEAALAGFIVQQGVGIREATEEERAKIARIAEECGVKNPCWTIDDGGVQDSTITDDGLYTAGLGFVRQFVEMKPGDAKHVYDDAPEGFRSETDDELRARIQSKETR